MNNFYNFEHSVVIVNTNITDIMVLGLVPRKIIVGLLEPQNESNYHVVGSDHKQKNIVCHMM